MPQPNRRVQTQEEAPGKHDRDATRPGSCLPGNSNAQTPKAAGRKQERRRMPQLTKRAQSQDGHAQMQSDETRVRVSWPTQRKAQDPRRGRPKATNLKGAASKTSPAKQFVCEQGPIWEPSYQKSNENNNGGEDRAGQWLRQYMRPRHASVPQWQAFCFTFPSAPITESIL